MFIYQTDPIDFFDGAVPISEAGERMVAIPGGYGLFNLIRLAMECSRAVALAGGSYWEGDIRGQDLYVFGIPDPGESAFRLGLMWKQDNNGSTFICSPVALPWISDDCMLSAMP